MSQRGVTGNGGALFADEGQDGLLHRAFLRGAGYTSSEVRSSPVIGIASSASGFNPCNIGLSALVEDVKRGVREAGGIALEFPTISISEPFTRPTSMLLRNLMSMDVEEMISALPIDGVVLLGGCDKTVPAQLMGAISADKPALMVVAGPRPVSCFRNNDSFTIDDVWPACEARRIGELGDDDWLDLEGAVNVGPGTCNVMGTATTMAAVAEALGFALPGSALAPSGSAGRQRMAVVAGREIVAAVERAQAPSSLLSREHIENAFSVVAALGGSTNAILHLVAIAGRAGFEITPDEIDTLTRGVPYLVNVRPGGPFLLADLEDAGGVPAVMHALGAQVDTAVRAADGRSWSAHLPAAQVTGPVITSMASPVTQGGALRVIHGNIAPSGAILKSVGRVDQKLLKHEGHAVVFEGIEDLNARIDDPDLPVDKDSVLVLRGMGMMGAPGMPEVGHIPIPAKLQKLGVHDMLRISDARMSGTATGTIVLHIAPEAAAGGPLALVRTGDLIRFDADVGILELIVSDDELDRRELAVRPARADRGYRWLHTRESLQPDRGCDFEFLLHRDLRRASVERDSESVST